MCSHHGKGHDIHGNFVQGCDLKVDMLIVVQSKGNLHALALEFDGASHKGSHAKAYDMKKDEFLRNHNIPLCRIKYRSGFSGNDSRQVKVVRTQVEAFLGCVC